MSEFVTIQVGQCGNQIGGAFWPQILKEYNVSIHQKPEKRTVSQSVSYNSLSSFFNLTNLSLRKSTECMPLYELLNNQVKARAVCIDMEDSVVSRFRTGPLKGLFDERCLLTNYPGSGNNWAEGFCEHGPNYKAKILKVLRHVVERCDSLHGFLMLFSTGGGTGSGLGTYVLNLLTDNYPKIERFVSCVYSTGTEDVITCPYNNALATYQLLQNATCVFPVENRCLLNIVSQKCRNNFYTKTDISSLFKPFEDMNNIIVEMLLHLTSGSRFPGSLNFDMNEINTNMVPFPQMHFLSAGFNHLNNSCATGLRKSSKQIKENNFLAACNRSNQMIKVEPLGSKSILLASTIIGRGDYTLTDLQSYTEKLQAKGKFTPWSRKCVKAGLCSVAPKNQSSALFSLFNTTGMYSLFENIYGQYNKLYRKKAHIYHYQKIDNFDSELFTECQESLLNVIQKYKELEQLVPVCIPRLKPLIE
ncbi:tubulin epsilon chain-like [Sitophilus oryzae]|uniref:Tubulin epsilon chain-like n=1 Tax=Sitophilus oryzae TaxID=7048 RepID=A0A6J2Y0H2_SITOR|nr:tubulin epsilon chain-like [Sitophilus oryzae]